jgi:hypothetical protein
MPDAAYLRRQAETCLHLARTTFDLSTAERLRFLAADLSAKADAVEDRSALVPHMMNGNSSSRSGENGRG